MLLALAVLVGSVNPARAQFTPSPPPALQKVDLEQKLGAQLPPDTPFVDDRGQPVTLGHYFQEGKPVAILLVWFDCQMLCTAVLDGMVRALQAVPFDAGKDYELVVISIDPKEDSVLASQKKANYLQAFMAPPEGQSGPGRTVDPAGWHFLTGQESSIRAVADTLGYSYAYDERSGQFAHPGAMMLATPQGKVSHYFYGVAYLPRDVRLGMVEASAGTIGSVVDKVLLRCFKYDPASGAYGWAIFTVLRTTGVATVVLLVGFIVWALRRERRQAREPIPAAGGA